MAQALRPGAQTARTQKPDTGPPKGHTPHTRFRTPRAAMSTKRNAYMVAQSILKEKLILTGSHN